MASKVPLMSDMDDMERGNVKVLQSGGASSGKRGFLFNSAETFDNDKCVAAAQVSIRMGFLRKVFGILAVQLTVTTIVSAFVVMYPGAKGFVQGWPFLMFGGFIASIGLLIAMLVKRHDTPINYFLLAAWTIVQSYTVATVVTFYDVDVVVVALLLTSLVTLSLFAYASQTTRDWSAGGAALYVALLVLIGASLLQLVLMSPVFDMMLACAGAVIFSLYIVFDVHMMMHHLSPEEYILATINLYLDIINLFLNILRILQSANRQ